MTQCVSKPPVVVVGFDGWPYSQTALAWAVGWAKQTGATVRVVTSCTWPVSGGQPVALGRYDPVKQANDLLQTALTSIDLPPERVSGKVADGPAGPALLNEARDADMLVVGCRGRGGVTRTLLGSVSSYVVHHAECPVVVVRDSPQSVDGPTLLALQQGGRFPAPAPRVSRDVVSTAGHDVDVLRDAAGVVEVSEVVHS